MSSRVPSGWRRVKLGEVFSERKEKGTASLPVASVSIEHGLVLRSSLDRRVQSDLLPEGHALVRKGDIAYNMMRMWQGACGLAQADCIISPAYVVMTPTHDIEPQFANIMLRSQPVMELLHGYSQGIVDDRLRLYPDAFAQIPISLPPLDEQRRIAQVLLSVDDAIAATQAVYDVAISAQAAAFERFLLSGNYIADSSPITGWTTGKIDGILRLPASWEIVKLIDVARLESGHTPDRKKHEYWNDGNVNWISLHDTQNLERCEICRTDMRITQAGLANSSARLLPPGTVCFSRTATVGKCVIMAKSMATSQDFANFICSPKLNNRYLLHLMRWMQPVWKQLASGSTHKTIYMPTFKALQIILPPRAEQDGIAAIMDGFVSVTEGHAASLTRLRSMKAAITSDLLSGRVRVPA